MTGAIYEKKFDGQQFYQYQQNEQSPLTPTHRTQNEHGI
jgi:hypothetical protein